MTTREPGASEVFTQGLARRPRSTARRANRPAPTMTWGFDVLVQLVMAATTTSPSDSRWWGAAFGASTEVRGGRSRAARNFSPAAARDTRSWGRDGPARDGSTSARSRVAYSEYTGSTPSAVCQRPWALA